MDTLDKFSLNDVEIALAKQSLWDFSNIIYPKFYLPDRAYLKDICDKIEDYALHSDKHFLIINAPPRHGKSITAQTSTAWLMGQDPSIRIMTASYNERLAGVFSRNVRNMIQTEKVGNRIVYSDIFPATKVKYGESAAQMWSLEGQGQVSYLATSPNATATGFGCDYLICDDLIRSAEEAYNENALEQTWQWFVNTMLSRLEGKRKVIIIMTRWSERDLAGRIIEAYGEDVELVTYQAQDAKGKMLDDRILSAKDYEFLKQEMNVDIVEANYNQKPIDITGRLYNHFMEWEKLPTADKIYNYTDTADTGTDYLCSVNYVVYNKEAYITGLVFTDEPMEVTEKQVAELLHYGNVNEANIESNNGGRGFARNVETLLKTDYNSNRCVIRATPQTHNKESRILASSAWVANHVFMPYGWQKRYPEFYKQVIGYQRKGKNAHDDAVDVLAAIYESITGTRQPEIVDKHYQNAFSRRQGSYYWVR